jgi:hypothetical protein
MVKVATSILLLLILGMLLLAAMPMCGCGGQITKSIANCRQVVISIRLYAADHAGAYPDSAIPLGTHSNTVFRELFKAGSLEDEKIFGCEASRYIPDGFIGAAPYYMDAVAAGENRWAMTKGLDDAAAEDMPVIYENPAEASWPPTWNPAAADQPVKGRAWSDGRIVK